MKLQLNPLNFVRLAQTQPVTTAVTAPVPVAIQDNVQLGSAHKRLLAKPTHAKQTPASAAEAAKAEEMVKRLFGPDFTLDQLKASVSDCLPGALPIVKLGVFEAGNPGLNVSLDWRGSDGQQVATSSIFWEERSAGVLAMQWRNVWLDPNQRQTGFFEKLADNQIQLLLDHSKHPDSVLELGAGGSHGLGQSEMEIVGKYLWAKLGLFEFATPAVQLRMAESFAGWLKEKAGQHSELTPALVDGLCKSAHGWTRPEQYAELDVPFFRLPTRRHDREVPVALGKAFLLDPNTSGWFGTCKINQIDPEILSRAQRALAFGGRSLRQSQEMTPAPQQTAEQLQAMSSEISRPLAEREQHAESLVALQGQLDLKQFAQLFTDKLSAADFEQVAAKLDSAAPAEQRAAHAFHLALEHRCQKIAQECQQQTGKSYSAEQIQKARVESFTDLDAFRKALLNVQ